ncbi:hypothetical protein MPTK1_8g06870 [Marchantia polymorpha subsp. ruderalis]|uniref:Uncharacterized protein n=1 Tax=Marchantia polymorpha TaxID=3197 RepID=A0A2R6XID9_MARPO|nr:hypothetical protein MARPO_0013s0105 [Marchantia polymorpha]BBN18966.1 hypothetical protein Mp_8g06870 [Marchantia polymorpha subsp. ruderalis]|eukprot:PTQ45880.1 hypothetical protein MARPO_0013s0105 [Marchantia polymorpha]
MYRRSIEKIDANLTKKERPISFLTIAPEGLVYEGDCTTRILLFAVFCSFSTYPSLAQGKRSRSCPTLHIASTKFAMASLLEPRIRSIYKEFQQFNLPRDPFELSIHAMSLILETSRLHVQLIFFVSCCHHFSFKSCTVSPFDQRQRMPFCFLYFCKYDSQNTIRQ